jgi:hypothetical protein
MIRSVNRRLERLETRSAATGPKSFSCRILLIDPVEGLTGVLVIDSESTTHVPGTPEEEERVRVSLENVEQIGLSYRSLHLTSRLWRSK